ncbi:hypothetical protein LTR95_008702 [Oleoguttula sp. CCFEE 5521]
MTVDQRYVAAVTTVFFTLLVILICRILFKLLDYCHCFHEHSIASHASLDTAELVVEKSKPRHAAMPGTQTSKKERKRIKLRERGEKRKAEQEESALSELVNGWSEAQQDDRIKKVSATSGVDAPAAGTKSTAPRPELTRYSPAFSTDAVKAGPSKAPAAATFPVPQISVTQNSAGIKQEEQASAALTKAPEPTSARPIPSTPAVQTPDIEAQRETAQPTLSQTPKISSSESSWPNEKKPANDTSLKRKPSNLESTKSEKFAKQKEDQPSMKTQQIAIGGDAAGNTAVPSSTTEDIAMSDPIPTESSLKRKPSKLESAKSEKIARQEPQQLSVDADRTVVSDGAAVTTVPTTAQSEETSITDLVPSAPRPSRAPSNTLDASLLGEIEKSELAAVPGPQLRTPKPTPEPESKPVLARDVADADLDTLMGEAGGDLAAMSQPERVETTDLVPSRDHEATTPGNVQAKPRTDTQHSNDEDTPMDDVEPVTDARRESPVPKPFDWNAELQALFANLNIKTSHGRLEEFQRLTLAFHCSLCPDKFRSPRRVLSEIDLQTYARELCVLFLRRYGSWIWPRSRTCAPHLIDRGLSYKRHGRLSNSGRFWYVYEGLEMPRRGDFEDVARSALRKRVQYWFEHLITSPVVWEEIGVSMSMEAALLGLLAGRAESGQEAKPKQEIAVPEHTGPEMNGPGKPLSMPATATETPMSTATVAQGSEETRTRATSPVKSRAPSPAKSTASSDVFPNYASAYSSSATYIPPVPVPVLNDEDLPALTPARSATSSEEDRFLNDSRATDPYAISTEEQEMVDEVEAPPDTEMADQKGISAYAIDLIHQAAVRKAAMHDFKLWAQGRGSKEAQGKVLRALAQKWFPGDRHPMPAELQGEKVELRWV